MISLTVMTEGKPSRSISAGCLPRWSAPVCIAPPGQGGAPGTGRVAKAEVVGLSKEKVEELFWDRITQARADLAGVPRNVFHYLVQQME